MKKTIKTSRSAGYLEKIFRTISGTKPKGSNSRKYVCPNCGAIVRATRNLEIICKPCMVDFVPEG